jgi:GTP-binding protein EngB required for normal cell division
MKQIHREYIEKFEQVKSISEKYGLPTEKLDKCIQDIENFKVTTPIIGGFSTGKSSLINFLLGDELLLTGITPETAIPAEISFGRDTVEYVSQDGNFTTSLEEYKVRRTSLKGVSLVRISLNNDFLDTIPTVKLVDMPGFDSGYDVHNRAINDYLPNSLAYIITVSADEGTLKESIINFLHELKLSEIPVYVVVTKSDKVMPDELDGIISHIGTLVREQLGLKKVSIITTSSFEDEGSTEFKEILTELQRQSDNIFIKSFSKRLSCELVNVQQYLQTCLKRKDFSSEQLLEDIKTFEDNIVTLKKDIAKEQEKFARQTERCIESIKNKVKSDLINSAETLEAILLQGNDISEKVNLIVRNSITNEINHQFEPKIRQYTKNIDGILCDNIMSLSGSPIPLDSSIIAENEELKSSLNGLITPVTTVVTTLVSSFASSTIATTLGLTSAVLGPVGIAVGILAGAIIGNGINKSIRQKEENQRREMVRKQLNRIIEDVIQNVGSVVENTIYKIQDNINEAIEKEVQEKIDNQKKALSDTQEKLKLNELQRQQEYNSITLDIALIENMLKSVRSVLINE